ncbi:trehalose-phosphatase [Bartonella tamiae]|uniref:trehalose-phosphatase n=1 Tax=Bartonella tamiae TaxID=373638 RepID=UPI0002EB5F11|nr:trehalose-phosphatase [Bartonella tamiae]
MTNAALFFDLDGTLIDIAPTPDGVIIPSGLALLLIKLSQKVKGALAINTGRSIRNVDALLGIKLPISGLHGGQIRYNKDCMYKLKTSSRLLDAKKFLFDTISNVTGLVIEDKDEALALHYRLVPNLRSKAEDLMKKAHHIAGNNYELQKGQMVYELKPAGVSKATALHNFMQYSVFRYRRPICFGDDLTDEDMFGAAKHYGGFGVKVGNTAHPTLAIYRQTSPGELYQWLESKV